MESVTVTGIQSDTGRFVSDVHFGGNTLYTRNTDNGIPDENYMTAVEELDVGYLRYPAGHPDVAYIDGMVIDGQLPEHLVNFMETAQATGHRVLIVTPSHAAYSDAAEVGEFAGLLVEQFPDTVHAFEIGNEYYRHQTETSYGQVANDSVLAISDAIDAVGVDVPIWVQMGQASGSYSEFHWTNDERGYLTRTIESNQTILDQISEEARAEIDGVVEHFYLRGMAGEIDPFSQWDQMLSLDLAIWRTTLGEDITFAITEWNVRVANLDNLGMKAASSLLAHFTHIVDLGADEAYVWPPHLNTAADLAGSGEVLTDPATGVVINSVGGAMFDLMSTQLPGLELVPASWSFGYEMFHTIFANDDRVVVYVASRSDETESISFSLGDWFGDTALVSATQIGYDRESSDGRHYNYETDVWDQSQSLIVNGEVYYVNEHDVRATVTELSVIPDQFNTPFEITLLPYEVVQLVYEIPAYIQSTGTDVRDVLATGDDDDLVQALGGDDSVTTGGGSDTIFGGDGDDYLNSGADADSVEGGQGSDSLRGWGGNDTLIGGDGNDDLQGWNGADSLVGSAGDDRLLGGDGNDVLVDGLGSDYIDAGVGDDTIFIENGDSLQSTENLEILRASMSDEALLEALTADHVVYTTVIDGGNGFDVVNFGDANDAFFLHDNISAFHNSVQQTGDSSGNAGRARLSGLEEINLGAGNDVLDLHSEDYSTGVDTLRIFGESGDDFIRGSGRVEHVFGGTGNDVVYGGGGADLIRGGYGVDSLFGGDGADTLEGGDGWDLLDGGQGFDHIWGGSGYDRILAGGSADRVYGGDGNDWISGGSNLGMTVDGLWGEAGNDTIFGDGGFDMLDGGDGDDLLDGGHQADNLYGRDGNDELRGGQGLDRLFGGTGDDLGHGGDGNDGLFGEAGNDTLFGDAGDDRFFGGSGNDLIFGGADNDTINGGSGFDTIEGGTGNDLLFGRFNADVFVFADGHGQDTIGDFAARNDFERIDLRDVSAISELNDLDLSSSTTGAATQSGSDVLIATGDSNWIVLSDTNLSDLDANDFIF
ncbi:calcium-binding protein [uncultured Tateyamaria sp.]|uniref:calcium-binding protein n=1 Tax=uncultured Tateyamaria sp. TaxID=455651 RepID=UPI0026084AC1|nr:calcium-binding protein [uncultured Tateyamaria sp.]